jgi:hypothetical protein
MKTVGRSLAKQVIRISRTGVKVSRNSLEQAIGLIEMGKPIEAQKVLKPLIVADHHDLSAWFWFIETCSTNKQRLNVLEICLECNPDNEQVKQALDRLRSASLQNLSTQTSIYSTLSSSNESIEIGIPENIKVNKNFHHLRIAVKWFRFKFIALTLFVIGFGALWSNLHPTVFPLERVIYIAVNIGLIYYVLAGYLNKTFIDVDFNSIIVRYEPLPAWGEKTISTKTIAQLYVEGDYFFGIENKRTGYHFYTVRAIPKERRIVKLVQGLDIEEASFVKQEIEKFLYIDEFARLI